MTISTASYTVSMNEPLNHARILYAPLGGTVTADGSNGAYAQNDYTMQRWSLVPGTKFNQGSGYAHVIRQVRISVNDGTDIAIGVIKAGKALQMPIPIYGGHRPLNLNRVTEAQQQFSEAGQWLGRIIKRRAVTTTYEWEYLKASWYDANFEPFAQTLPLNPFCIAGNPSKIGSDVGFVWTDRDPEPVQMGIKSYRSVSLGVTGYY